MMMNSVSISGRLTRDVEMRQTKSGTAVGSFTLAVDRRRKSADGKREADFISCVIWDKGAELFAKYTSKGTMVGIEGHIQTRTYDNAQGTRVYVTEVVVDNFTRFGSNNVADEQQVVNTAPASQTASTFGGGSSAVTPRPASTAASATSVDPFAANGQPIDVSDDDLPF